MDLSGQTGIQTTWAISSGMVTVTFKDFTGTTTLGTLILEAAKFRSMIKALDEMSRTYLPDGPANGKARTNLTLQTNVGSTKFE